MKMLGFHLWEPHGLPLTLLQGWGNNQPFHLKPGHQQQTNGCFTSGVGFDSFSSLFSKAQPKSPEKLKSISSTRSGRSRHHAVAMAAMASVRCRFLKQSIRPGHFLDAEKTWPEKLLRNLSLQVTWGQPNLNQTSTKPQPNLCGNLRYLVLWNQLIFIGEWDPSHRFRAPASSPLCADGSTASLEVDGGRSPSNVTCSGAVLQTQKLHCFLDGALQRFHLRKSYIFKGDWTFSIDISISLEVWGVASLACNPWTNDKSWCFAFHHT